MFEATTLLETAHESDRRREEHAKAGQERGRPAGDHCFGGTGRPASANKGPDEKGQEPGRVLGHVRRRRRRLQRVGVGQRPRKEEELRRQVHQQNEVIHNGQQEDSYRRIESIK